MIRSNKTYKQKQSHTSFSIRERRQSGQQARNSGATHDTPVREERVQPNRAFTHMHQPLSDPDHEQRVGFFLVVTRELSEHLRETGVVRSSADEAHGEDGVDGDGEVVVVAVFREGVEDG